MINYLAKTACGCGRLHSIGIDEIAVGSGVIERLPEFVRRYGARRPFVFADNSTCAAAGERVCRLLAKSGLEPVCYVFPHRELEPNEEAVGSLFMHFDTSCDIVIGVGSGVINDIGKILSMIAGKKYIIVATAPSMDGYASSTSSMAMDGLKISLDSHCADIIVGDLDILKEAPENMLKAGLGDMLAKYVAVAEWRVGRLVTGEYYCDAIAQMMRDAVKRCVENADGLLQRDEDAVRAVFESLIVSGIAAAYAGVSRPASGVEHYFSHIWDMRGLQFGSRVELHGIQCALGTLTAARLYEAVKQIRPDRARAMAYAERFDYGEWCGELRRFLGKSADTMIAQEARENKYDKEAHRQRYQKIAENWYSILRILDEELPSSAEIARILDIIGVDKELSALGVDRETARMTFKATKDVRNKYILSRLAWDLGVLDELAELI